MTKTEWSKRLLSTSSYQPINRISNCMFYNSTSIVLMWELHVKIDNQAFMFIHVVEQVQLFKWVQHVISASPSDSEIVRGDQVVPVRSTVLTQLINSKVLWIKKMADIHVWKWWRSLACYVPLCAIGLRVLFQSVVSFWCMHMQSFDSDYMQQNRENPHKEIWSCAGMHTYQHTWTPQWFAPWYSCLLSGLVLEKGFSCRAEVAAVGFDG